jgi:putative transposase
MGFATELSEVVGKAQACDALGLARASFYRWANPKPAEAKPRRTSARALTSPEREEVLLVLNSERFMDKAPREVYATLLDEQQYLCSPRTMYRILEANGQVRERRDQLRHPSYKKPELLATAPNQVWSWDITKLLGPAKWTYYYLYVILDIFSRYVVGWMVAQRESAALAQRLIIETVEKEEIHEGQLTIHADRGSSMASKTVALLLADLGVVKSHSRPHVSDDNPFSEAQFKTLKYRPEFPERFGSIEDARTNCRALFHWYNQEHRHMGIALLTPDTVHHGRAQETLERRQEVLSAAYGHKPERFVRGQPVVPQLPEEVWINPPRMIEGGNQDRTDFVPQSDLPESPRIDDLKSPRPVAPPEITRPPRAPATERGVNPVNQTRPEQDQQAARSRRQPPTRPVPNAMPLPGEASRRLTKKTVSALH